MYCCDRGVQGMCEEHCKASALHSYMHGALQMDIMMQLALEASEKSAQIAAAVQNAQIVIVVKDYRISSC
jgi:hypothetical protein